MARVVDFSFHHPRFAGFEPLPKSTVGAYFCMGVLKKALLQSVPWAFVVLAGFAVVALRKGSWRRDSPREREIISMALIVGAVVALFTLAGPGRIDGVCFNQRYFFDLLPLLAVCFAWLTEDCWGRDRFGFLIGIAAGLLAVIGILRLDLESTVRHILMLKVPVVVGGIAAILWLPARAGRLRPGFPVLAGVCLSWALGVHVLEELPVSRNLRAVQASRKAQLAGFLDDRPAAVFAHYGFAQAMGPLQLSRDLVVVDPWTDMGKDAPRLIDEFMARGRRVLLVVNDFPKTVFDAMCRDRRLRWIHRGNPKKGGLGILEVLPHPGLRR
jgi:hypothetical protein